MQHPVEFISLGPGEAGLITVKGLKALQSADCIFCPETQVGDRRFSRAADILQELGIASHKLRRFVLPMSKQRQQALEAYDQTGSEAILLQKAGKKVCIVAEGDAGFYSSVHYVYDKLRACGIPVGHVAGIPAFIAAGARAGLHIASQEECMTVIPGTATAGKIEQLVQEGGAVVIMKLSQCADEVHRCIRLHPEYSYHYFENVGTDKELYTDDTRQIGSLRFPYFSLLIIRKGAFSD